MKNLAFVFILVFFAFSDTLRADDWDLFPYNQKTYYHFQKNDMESIAAFYVDYEEDTEKGILQFPLRTYIESQLPMCYPPPRDLLSNYNHYWILTTVLLKDNAENQPCAYLNNYHDFPFNGNPTKDTLLFDQYASLGESWEIHAKVFEHADFPHDALRISCISIDYEEIVEGIMDSTKTYSFQTIKDNQPVENNLNEIVFKLSKHHGLIQWIPLHHLFFQRLYDHSKVQITLFGFEDEQNILRGQGTPKPSDFFPYQVGDQMSWEFATYPYTSKEIRTVKINEITKTDSSFQAVVDRTKTFISIETNDTTNIIEETNLNFGYTIPQRYIDYAFWGLGITLYEYDSENNYFEADYDDLNLRLIPNDDCGSMYELTIGNPHCGIYGGGIEDFFCEFICVGFDGGHESIYNTNLGYISTNDVFSSNPPEHLNLIEADVGDCFFTNIESPSYLAQQITLHPNPTQNHFLLQLQNPKRQNLTLEVTDIHGRVVLNQEILEDTVEVDLSDSSNGIYLVQISDGKHWWTEKVMKY